MIVLALATTQPAAEADAIPADMLALCSLESGDGCGSSTVIDLTAEKAPGGFGSPLASTGAERGCDPFEGCRTVARSCRVTRDVARALIETVVNRAFTQKRLGLRRSDMSATIHLFVGQRGTRANDMPIYFLRADLSRVPLTAGNQRCILSLKSIALSRNSEGAPIGQSDEVSQYLTDQVWHAMR